MTFPAQEEGSNQLMTALSFSPPVGGGDAVTTGGGVGGLPLPFDMADGKIVRCGLWFGRMWLECEDTELQAVADGATPSGVIYASVAHAGTARPTLSVRHGNELPENGLDVTNRALYRATSGTEGRSWEDLRLAMTIVAMAS